MIKFSVLNDRVVSIDPHRVLLQAIDFVVFA